MQNEALLRKVAAIAVPLILLAALIATPLAGKTSTRRVLVDLPRLETPPAGFRRVHRSDRRDFAAGVHTGDSIRWEGSLPCDDFAKGGAA